MAITSRKYVRNCRHIRQRKKFSVIFATTLTFDGLLSCYSSRIPNTDEVSDASRDIKYLIRTVWDGLPVISTKKTQFLLFRLLSRKAFWTVPARSRFRRYCSSVPSYGDHQITRGGRYGGILVISQFIRRCRRVWAVGYIQNKMLHLSPQAEPKLRLEWRIHQLECDSPTDYCW